MMSMPVPVEQADGAAAAPHAPIRLVATGPGVEARDEFPGIADLEAAYDAHEERVFELARELAARRTRRAAAADPDDGRAESWAADAWGLRRRCETLAGVVDVALRRARRGPAFSVAAAMDAVRMRVEPRARGAYVEFVQRCATDALLEADRRLFERVIALVVSNRIRLAAADRCGGVACVVTDGPRGFVRIVVRGPAGGRHEAAPPVLRPFAAWRRAVGGAVLARFLVQTYVRRHGGRIAVEASPAETRLKILLPSSPR